MADPMNKHYESKFEFPLLKLIKQRAKEKDISYHDATLEVMPEYIKTIRYGDTEFELAEMRKYDEENEIEMERWQEMTQNWSKKGE